MTVDGEKSEKRALQDDDDGDERGVCAYRARQ